MSPFEPVRRLAATCATEELCVDLRIASAALSIPESATKAALQCGQDAGYFRRRIGCFQPTLKAVGSPKPVPSFLRHRLSPNVQVRGLLRGFVRFIARPELSFLSVSEQDALLKSYQIKSNGFSRASVGLNGAHMHVFAPILATDKPATAIESACLRWLNLLDSGCGTLHFVTPEGAHIDALREAVAVFSAASGSSVVAQRELAEIEAEIAADRYGTVAIKKAARVAQLRQELASVSNDLAELFPFDRIGDLLVY